MFYNLVGWLLSSSKRQCVECGRRQHKLRMLHEFIGEWFCDAACQAADGESRDR